MANIYLAARYSRNPEMREVASVLNEHGHLVTSRWIWGSHELREDQSDTQRENFAIEDIEDLTKADIVVSFTEEPDAKPKNPSKGGRHVEFGMGIALNKRLIVVGPNEHIFHWLPGVEHYESLDELLTVLGSEEADGG